jgi:large subunit ribosomal protein L18
MVDVAPLRYFLQFRLTKFINSSLVNSHSQREIKMGSTNIRQQARLKRKKRIRKKIYGTQQRPRLSVFRSARHTYAQVVDDTTGHTLAAASTLDKEAQSGSKSENKVEAAKLVGKLVGQRALGKGIKEVVFDRNGFLYHGRIKSLSEGAREAGLVF